MIFLIENEDNKKWQLKCQGWSASKAGWIVNRIHDESANHWCFVARGNATITVNKNIPRRTQLPTRRRSSSEPDPTFTERNFVFPKFRVYVSRIKRLCQS